MTFLMPSLIKRSQVTQRHGKNKEIERIEKLLIIVSRNVKQNNAPWPCGLIFAPTFKPANREVRGSPKEARNRVLSVERPVMTARRNRNHLGIYPGQFFEEFLDAAV